jgi:hypothetical protein
MFIIFYSSISPAGGGLFVYSVQPFQLHPIKHPRLFNHPAPYHIIQIIRRFILGIQAQSLYLIKIEYNVF